MATKDKSTITDSTIKYEAAKKRVGEIKDFYTHVIVYVVVNIFLIVINLLTSPGRYWFFFATIFWGFGLFMHFLATFVFDGFMGAEWEEKKIKEILEKNK